MKRKCTLRTMLMLFALLFTITCLAGCNNSQMNKTISSVDEEKIYTSGNISYKVLDNEVEIVGIKGSVGKTWVIPETINSKKVTRLSFTYTNEELTSVTVPSTVYSIRNNGFRDCANLKEVIFAEGCAITEIPSESFSGTSLKAITIPKTVKSIAFNAFAEVSSLTTVTFAEDSELRTIGSAAFSDCTGLKSIKIPSKVEKIAESAFYHCINLTTVDMTDATALRSIDQYAFSACRKLESIACPENLYTIDNHAFRECISLKSVTLNNKLQEIGTRAFYNTANVEANTGITELVIPNTVTRIGDEAFANSGVTKLTITSQIATVGDRVFKECDITNLKVNGNFSLSSIFTDDVEDIRKMLTKVEIAEGATRLVDGLFSGCIKITSVTVPNTVNEIGKNCFEGCAMLGVAYLPASLKVISEGCFDGCVALNRIYVGGNEIDENTKISQIGAFAFNGCTSLTSFEIPNAVTRIENNTFANCTNLANISIGSDITFVGDYAFNNCDRLSFGVLSNKVTSVGAYAFYNCASIALSVDNKISSIGAYAFSLCDMSNPLVINSPLVLSENLITSDGIGNVGDNAFEGVSGIRGLTIPAAFSLSRIFGESKDDIVSKLVAVEIIGDSPIGANEFEGAIALTTLRIGPNIPSIGESAFAGANISTLQLDEGALAEIGVSAFEGCLKLTSLEIPSNMEIIYDRAFANCINLEEITLSANVELGEAVFYGSTKVSRLETQGRYGIATLFGETKVAVAQNLTNITIIPNTGNSQVIETEAFVDCVKLTSITIPDVVTSIGDRAFKGCKLLDTLVLETQNITTIGESAFEDCISIANINFGSQLETIGAAAFRNCSGLNEQFVLPVSLKTIGDYAFERCSHINIELPEGIEEIGAYAFSGCSALTQIYSLPDSITTISAGVFNLCTKLTNFAIDINKITTIGESAFAECVGLKPYFVSEEGEPVILNSIGDNAFKGCLNLKFTTLPNTVREIGNYAFYDCPLITDFILPAMINTIGDYAFAKCEDMAVSFDDLVYITSIGAYAFSECSRITDVVFTSVIDNNLNIGASAFEGCANIANIDVSRVNTIGDGAFAAMKPNSSPEIHLTVRARDTYATLFGLTSNANNFIKSVVIVESSSVHIPDFAYADCVILDSIEIADNIVNIGERAFANSNIKLINLPSALTRIFAGAFADCKNLPGVLIPASTTQIQNSAFENCVKLDSVTFEVGSQIQFIGDYAFAGICMKDFTLPLAVRTIGEGLFARNAVLENLTLHDSITSIGKYAFAGCTKLEIAELPKNDNITRIEEGTFMGCEAITNFCIRDNITYIGANAFAGCKQLKMDRETILEGSDDYIKMTNELPITILEIGDAAFASCTLLELSELPADVTIIGANAFADCPLITISTATDNLVSIGDGAFMNCLGITNFAFKKAGVRLGNSIFEGCVNISALAISGDYSLSSLFGSTIESIKNTMKQVTLLGDTKVLADGMFKDFTALEYVGDAANGLQNIPIESIGSEAFKGCSSIKAIIIPSTVETIGDYAFSGTGITAINIPANVRTIGASAFLDCKSLASVTIVNGVDVDDNVIGLTAISNNMFENTAIKTIIIPVSVTSIGEYAFKNCASLSSCTINANISTIEKGTFASTPIESIILPATISSIADEAFSGCMNLKTICESVHQNVNLGYLTSLTSIGNSAFAGCKKLTDVVIPGSVYQIGGSAFENCANLSNVTFNAPIDPENVLTEINGSAFSGTLLETLELPNTITRINNRAFAKNEHLKEVVMSTSSSLAYIGEEAFIDCVSLSRVYIPRTVGTIDKSAFANCVSLYDIVFDSANVNLTTISESAFKNCTAIKTLVLPTSITEIGASAFNKCTSLKTLGTTPNVITLPVNLTTLGDNAFVDCTDIYQLVVNDSLKIISRNAFQKCSSLYNVDLANVEEIDDYAFNLTALTSLLLPNSILKIGESAFVSSFAQLPSPDPESVFATLTIGDGNSTNKISIAKSAFATNDNLGEVVIGSRVVEFGESVFNACINLKKVDMDAATIYDIPNNMFNLCGKLSDVILPRTLRRILDLAFNGTAIEEIDFTYEEDGITQNIEVHHIGANAFATSGLKSFDVPASVTYIGRAAFNGCNALDTVNWGINVPRIESNTFTGCTSLLAFTIPASVMSIGDNAFSAPALVSSLELTFLGIEPPAMSHYTQTESIFSGFADDLTIGINVPAAARTAYQEYLGELYLQYIN